MRLAAWISDAKPIVHRDPIDVINQGLRDSIVDIDHADTQAVPPSGQPTTGRGGGHFVHEDLHLVAKTPAGNHHVIDPNSRLVSGRTSWIILRIRTRNGGGH